MVKNGQMRFGTLYYSIQITYVMIHVILMSRLFS